jgi:hypothetical protein
MITAFLGVIFGLNVVGNNVTNVLSAVTKTMIQHDIIPDANNDQCEKAQLNEDHERISVPKAILTVLGKGPVLQTIISVTARNMRYTHVDFFRS